MIARSAFGGTRTVATRRRRTLRGYAASRQAYDKLRRHSSLEGFDLIHRNMCRRDPCAYCGGPGSDADHIVPLSGGGEHRYSNLTGCCKPCNASKRDRPLLRFLLARNG